MGKLLDELEKEGLLENTLVVYVSDQGFYMGSSSVTAQTVAADGLMLSQQNHAGITETAARAYTATGVTLTLSLIHI